MADFFLLVPSTQPPNEWVAGPGKKSGGSPKENWQGERLTKGSFAGGNTENASIRVHFLQWKENCVSEDRSPIYSHILPIWVQNSH